VPHFTLIREYLGVPGPKKRQIANIANFFATQGQIRCPMLVKSVWFMRVIGTDYVKVVEDTPVLSAEEM